MGVSNDTIALMEQMPFDGRYRRLRIDRNTLALWHFKDGSGTTVTDECGNFNLSFLGSGNTWVADASDLGYSYPSRSWGGGSGGVKLNGSGALQSTTLLNSLPAQWTIEGWFTPTSALGGNTTSMTLIFNESNSTNGDCLEVRWSPHAVSNANQFLARTTVGGSNNLTWGLPIWPMVAGGTVTWPAGWPLHIATTFDGTNQRVLLNGIPIVVQASGNPTNGGSPHGFVLGANYGSGSFNFGFVGTISEARVSNIARSIEELRASFEQRALPPIQSPQSVWVRSGTATITASGWESPAVYEFRPIYDPTTGEPVIENDGSIGATYTGSWSNPAIGIATSASGAGQGTTWTKFGSNPVIGNGSTGFHARSNPMKWNGQYIVSVSDLSGGSVNHLYDWISSTRTGTYTQSGSPLLTGISGSSYQSVANSARIYVNGQWYMWFDGQSAVDGAWRCHLAMAPNWNGPWTVQGVVQSLQLGGGTFGSACPPILRDGLWHMYLHSTPPSGGVLPTYGAFHFVSADLLHWTPVPFGPEMSPTPGGTSTYEYEQSGADPRPFELGKTTGQPTSFLCFDTINNSGPSSPGGAIWIATYAGSLGQLWRPTRQLIPVAAQETGAYSTSGNLQAVASINNAAFTECLVNDAGPTSAKFAVSGITAGATGYANMLVVFESGTLAGQTNEIQGWDGGSPNRLIFFKTWASAPASGDRLKIVGFSK